MRLTSVDLPVPVRPTMPTCSPGATNRTSAPAGRLRRIERRDQILAAATRAFARGGFVVTGLDDIAAEAGISRVVLYRHFESKADLYRAVLERTRSRIADTVGPDNHTAESITALVRAAAATRTVSACCSVTHPANLSSVALPTLSRLPVPESRIAMSIAGSRTSGRQPVVEPGARQ